MAMFGWEMHGGYFHPHIVDSGNAGGHVYQGSGGNWTDGLNMKNDMAFMFTNTFEKFYGVDLDNAEDRWSIAQSVGTRLQDVGAAINKYVNEKFFGVSPERGRRLAEYNADRSFVQLDANGHAYVPYTNISFWDYLKLLRTENQFLYLSCWYFS